MINSTVVRATVGTIVFGDDIEIDAYQLPSGEIRYSKTGAAKLLGHSHNWLMLVGKQSGKTLKALQDKGYSAYFIPVAITKQGGDRAGTPTSISGDI